MAKLGVISNIWAKRLAAGDRFEDLALIFGKEGFSDIEIRDGEYLRDSDFGVFLRELEKMSDAYPAAEWKGICGALASGENPAEALRPGDRPLFERVRGFKEKMAGITLTYSLQHPWMSRPADQALDDRRILSAKKLALLLSSGSARMRLVDLDSPAPIDSSAAAANLNRYRTLAGELPMVHAVENARHSARLILEIATGADFCMAYDEANLFLPGGRIIEPPEYFWQALDPRHLVSVHFKQKSGDELLPYVGPGRVDCSGILTRLRKIPFTGDLLLENAASENPLEEAKKSRDYLLGLAGA